jgi:hypothetical protein
LMRGPHRTHEKKAPDSVLKFRAARCYSGRLSPITTT